MGLGTLLLAVRDELRKDLDTRVPSDMIQVMFDGRPMPSCGQQFIAIHGSSWAPRGVDADMNRGLAEEYGVTCTLSMRSPVVPQDLLGVELYVKELIGMEPIARQIIHSIHQQFDIINEANRLANTEYGIIEYLRWQGSDAKPRPVGPEWFYSENPGVDSWEYIQSGLTMDIRFGGAMQMEALPGDTSEGQGV